MATPSLLNFFLVNLTGQLISRVCSFVINLYLLRNVDAALLGLVNVRLTLLYTSILFLVREPLRKACLSVQTNSATYVNHLWLAPVICFCFLLTLFTPLSSFCLAQVLSSTAYLGVHLYHYYKLSLSTDFTSAPLGIVNFRGYFPSSHHGLDRTILKQIGSFLVHSVFKQLLTDGSAFVMTFTNTIGLANQAVYDAIEKLGSLIARIVLAPLEESSYLYFSSQFERDVAIGDQPRLKVEEGVSTLKNLLRGTTLLSSVIIVFGIAYSQLAVGLYGGELLSSNQGGALLSCYLGYLFVMTINGITECFATATMSNTDIFAHIGFLFVCAFLYLGLNIGCSFYFAAFGFILANALNMAVRILYSWQHIQRYLRRWTPSFFELLPSVSTILLLVFSLFVTNLSNLIFGSTAGIVHNGAHIAIGGVMFLVVVLNIYKSELLLQQFVSRSIQHQD
ncbi:hypothetical protein QR680_002410 [Steinernema hermaphroditum]|uniref:Protein RFT1 homolog n=1 Tax=Steinernema hermaphroditum TaxID=289476 RepID=A0AA39H2K5_9BILA|nr:hypothetical protein QR680_002410 [Steinernema hermaphroditum]